MTKIFITLKDKLYLKNPIVIFSILVILFGLFFLIKLNLQIPDFYTNRDLAFQAAQLSPEKSNLILKQLHNKSHYFYNTLFHLWGWLITFLIISIVFKIKTFSDYIKMFKLKNKKFIYLWLNLSYIIYACCWLPAFMSDLRKYEYNTFHDSFGIPFFNTILHLFFFMLIYYPVTNLLFYAIYNTKIKKAFYFITLILLLIYFAISIISNTFMLFTYWQIGLNIFNLMWIFLIISGINFLKHKSISI